MPKRHSSLPLTARLSLTASSTVDKARFFWTWVQAPRSVAAIAPSGHALAELITRGINRATGPVLELGPGTGVFTQALIEHGVDEAGLTLVEFDPDFARLLRKRYRRATVLEMDAGALADRASGNAVQFGATICGLGLLTMSDEQVEAILRGAFAQMRPGASFFLFTYSRRCSVSQHILDKLGLSAEKVGTAWRNLPPASVFRLSRSSGAAN